LLSEIVSKIPRLDSDDLLVGFDTADDGAVYQLRDDLAIIQTLDFFPPLISDPYIFGQIAAANALSDVSAMGGDPILALNILAFPEDGDKGDLEAILAGGAQKVAEAGAILCGGHSISDAGVKYGMSVTGVVHPDKILHNNRCKVGDKIILTKPLGVGVVAIAYGKGEASKEAYDAAVGLMTTLNKHAMDVAKDFNIHAATDVTGFGFLGHLNEMVTPAYSIAVEARDIPFTLDAYDIATVCEHSGGAKKNFKHVSCDVDFGAVDAAIQMLMLDPQTSGGLLLSVCPKYAGELVKGLNDKGIVADVVGEVIPRASKNILIY